MELFDCLFLAAVFVFPAYLISLAVTGTAKRKEKAVEKAIRRGHVVTAVLKKTSIPQWNVPGLTTPGPHVLGKYEYKYKGKVYKYRFWSDRPPSTLTLYFINKPQKATVKEAIYDSQVSWIKVYLIVSGILYWLIGV